MILIPRWSSGVSTGCQPEFWKVEICLKLPTVVSWRFPKPNSCICVYIYTQYFSSCTALVITLILIQARSNEHPITLYSFLMKVLKCNTQQFREAKGSILAGFLYRILCSFQNVAYSSLLATFQPLEEHCAALAMLADQLCFLLFLLKCLLKNLCEPDTLFLLQLTQPVVMGHCTQHMSQR